MVNCLSYNIVIICSVVAETSITLEALGEWFYECIEIAATIILRHPSPPIVFPVLILISSFQMSGTTFICSHIGCGTTFKSKSGYQQHMKRHLGIYKYHCPYCNKGLDSSNNVKEHLRIHHTGIHGYHCTKCKLQCDNVHALKDHLEQNKCTV